MAADTKASRRRGLRLAVVGGGTGGHVVPGLHMLAALLASEDLPLLEDLVWFETGRAAEVASLARLEGLIGATPVARLRVRVEPKAGGAPGLVRLAGLTPRAFVAARRALKAHASQVVFGLGGFTLLPVVLAARSLGIPVVLLEINAVPGRAVRLLAPLAERVLHAWPSSMPASEGPAGSARHRLTGPPLGPEFTSRAPVPDTWREDLGVAPDAPLLCVLGGSQGAGALNDFVRASLGALLAAGVAVVHQVGPGRLAEACAPQPGYLPLEFVDDVASLLSCSTMALSRAGASTLAELAAMGLPAMVVPYPGAGGHQRMNAGQLEGGLLLVEQPELGPAALEALLERLGPAGEPWRAAARESLQQRVPRDAAERIARELVARAASS